MFLLNPIEVALFWAAPCVRVAGTHPHHDMVMIHIRTMSPVGCAERAPRINVFEGWNAFSTAASPGRQATDALCRLFLFTPGLRCPEPADGATGCARCLALPNPGVATLGKCYCPWAKCFECTDAEGKGSFEATLRQRMTEWEQKAELAM